MRQGSNKREAGSGEGGMGEGGRGGGLLGGEWGDEQECAMVCSADRQPSARQGSDGGCSARTYALTVLLKQWRRHFAFSVCKAAGRMGKTTLKIAHHHCLHFPPFPHYDLFRRCHGAAASHSVFTWQQAGWRDLQPEDPPAAPSDARSGGGWEMKCGRCEMCGPKVACKVGRVANFLPARRKSDAAPHKCMLPRS